MTIYEPLVRKDLGTMEEKKKIIPATNDWEIAQKQIEKYGYAEITTGSFLDSEWNQEVARSLSRRCDRKILYLGFSPDYNEDRGVYRYSIEVSTNREAAMFLSQTDD